MRDHLRRLSLSRETIRNLQAPELLQGGVAQGSIKLISKVLSKALSSVPSLILESITGISYSLVTSRPETPQPDVSMTCKVVSNPEGKQTCTCNCQIT